MKAEISLLALFMASPVIAAPITSLRATLTGAAETPGPGMAGGAGTAAITLDQAASQLCYTVSASGIDQPTMAHVHKGPVGVAGPVVVPLNAPENGLSKGCATVAADTIKAILASPADYYVNVHTAAHPAGAIRGQLTK